MQLLRGYFINHFYFNIFYDKNNFVFDNKYIYFAFQSTFYMNILKIWIKAQLYNFILALIICISYILYEEMQKKILFQGIDSSIKFDCMIFIIYTIVSFIGGLPLILFFKFITFLTEKSTKNNQAKKLIEIITYPLSTSLYIILLSILFKEFENLDSTEKIYIISPAAISTFISVFVNQYQDKKKKENEINNLTS
jgi:hypothetical protein